MLQNPSMKNTWFILLEEKGKFEMKVSILSVFDPKKI